MKQIAKSSFKQHIYNGQLTELFNELGWNYCTNVVKETDNNQDYNLRAIAEKAGFMVFICTANENNRIPNYQTRNKIHNQLAKRYHEHLIIFSDQHNTTQIWQLSIKEADNPERLIETKWVNNQDPELLYQRLGSVFFTIDEEDQLTIIDVSTRMRENFAINAERVTRRFYDSFKRQHTTFLDFIDGIADQVSKEWYASIMLNRLMFCYFIQKKGFLDNNLHYLRNKLDEVKNKQGDNQFYSFYRKFLLILFHEGLGSPVRSDEHETEIGSVPYLNGGLFDVHKLEEENPHIEIADEAFEKLFDYFDQWEWHLDVRPDSTGNEINPDVLGYIFEKYINDRSQMGAYYTREDITGYISKNCIIPFLFDEVKRNYPKAFRPGSFIWNTIKDDPDRYIYDAIKKGVYLDLPDDIAIGLDTTQPDLLERRKEWNKPAYADYALPTEIWREVVERRNRYFEVKTKITAGEINEINDFITYNLNILQFVQDIIEEIDEPDFIKWFYKALNKITILDPTCGSGAFLFAALNILEPLYFACLQRMESYVQEESKSKYKYFEVVIDQLKSPVHPNLKYFIYKNIILNNLYGVDIMNEAVEIAKLRLFLKLMACVEPAYGKENLGLEPLPDIDFNIRSGNTLVGFATQADLEDALQYTIEGLIEKPALLEKMQIVADAYKSFKEIQLTYGSDANSFKAAKNDLEQRLNELNDRLNRYLSKSYGVSEGNEAGYANWLYSHKPFHWFAEFYEIMNDGGFDVIIGNPPYVEYSKISDCYSILQFETKECGNVYGYIIERSALILNNAGLLGMIIPISAFSNASMKPLQSYIRKFPYLYISSYHQRPAALFDGVLQRLSILICGKQIKDDKIYTTKVYRWKSETRGILFKNIQYQNIIQTEQYNFLKVSNLIESELYKKFNKHKSISYYLDARGSDTNKIFYRTAGGGYWVTFLNTPFNTNSLSNKSTPIKKEYKSEVLTAALNSNLFWWYYSINFDQFNFKDYMIFGFRFNYPLAESVEDELSRLSNLIEVDLLSNATTYFIESRTKGRNETITYNKHMSKSIMDDIDKELAPIYGFNEEEIDFLINYDIKYRMGLYEN